MFFGKYDRRNPVRNREIQDYGVAAEKGVR